MPKSNLFFILLLGLIGGIAVGSWWELNDLTIKILFIPGLLVIGVWWRKNWRIVFWGVVWLTVVFGWLRLADFRPGVTYLTRFADTNFAPQLFGYVADQPQARGDRQQFVLRVKKIITPDGFVIPETLSEKILAVADPYPEVRYGQEIALRGKIKTPTHFSDFDYVAYLARDQIFTLVYRPEIAPASLHLSLTERGRLKFLGVIYGLKGRFEKSLAQAVTEPQASFLSGILLGSRQNLPPEIKDNFARVGLSHLLAISGYNITLVSLAVFSLLIFFWTRVTAFWLSLLAIAIFTVLTGASASVVRAALMGGLVLLAQQSGRLYHPRNALTLAAALMVVINPLILRYDIGFQLSFMATLGLLFGEPLLQPYTRKFSNFFKFRETLTATATAQLLVLPLIAFYFKDGFSLISLPANLLLLPLIPWTMLFGFLAGLAGMIWPSLGMIIGVVAWLLSTIILKISAVLAAWPSVSLSLAHSWLLVILAYGLIFWLGMVLKKKNQN